MAVDFAQVEVFAVGEADETLSAVLADEDQASCYGSAAGMILKRKLTNKAGLVYSAT